MRNCPDRFYLNCSLAQIKCHQCSAGTGHSKLLYNPIHSNDNEGDLLTHPWHKNISKSKVQLRAKKTEQLQRRKIADATLRSGALLGDGDTKLLGGRLKLETKDRGSKSSWCLSLLEYSKGQRQGIDVFGITISPPNSPPKTLYIIDEHLLGTILHLIDSQ